MVSSMSHARFVINGIVGIVYCVMLHDVVVVLCI